MKNISTSEKRVLQIDIDQVALQVHQQCLFFRDHHNGKNLPMPIVVTLQMDKVEILQWLNSLTGYPRIYWANRDGDLEIGGFGSTIAVSETDPNKFATQYNLIQNILHSISTNRFAHFLGGVGFNHNGYHKNYWLEFPRLWFVLPEIMLQRKDKKTTISVCSLYHPDSSEEEIVQRIIAKLNSLQFDKTETEFLSLPKLIDRTDQPDHSSWLETVEQALDLIHSREIEKIVLARKTRLSFESELNGFSILSKLLQRNQNCFGYLFQPEKEKIFLGVTPEQLFKTEHNHLFSEAVSGTMPRGGTFAEDKKIGQQLLDSDKNVREHRFVLDAIQEMMSDFCHGVNKDSPPELLKLSNVQHLISRVSGRLKKEISIYNIIAAMHPTPAVGGTPKEKAIQFIHQLEPFERGWYAAPVGIISQDEVEMVVALRSMLLYGRTAHLFAGAGIVEGSEPEAEWQEVESKVSIAMHLLLGEKY